MPTIETRLARLLDEAAIRDLIARFADCAIREDYDTFATLWAPDARWTIGKPTDIAASGTDDIVAMLRHLWQGNDYFTHFAIPGTVDLDGDTATTRTVCHEAASGPDGRFYRNNGVWSDRFQRTSDGWVFASRQYTYLWVDFSEFSGDAFAGAGRTL
ncbi:nuclear transport factor 2 family protein [Allobranchiibius sp. CTAmp26]|uniref:nuclear transport factor 2 family protein n=1 Tax=Allobranchiibius sp. CTAmp26 TaxID=2815214 RepID=UPI001AA0E15F|nr:nuclear transport factor 2 family protein [Allobranchiibius sp. CTAmp26]MBO1755278.1 nuclear transport factor 2 family protein [Allobranchiibius sp. CTAmp26]